jgi:hypothetical protein
MFSCTMQVTGSIKRLIMVTSGSEHKQIDPGVKGPDKGLKGHTPVSPINKSLIQLTQKRNK